MSPMFRFVGFEGIPASQFDDEFRVFLELVKRENVKSYLEVGVFEGITFHTIVSLLPGGGPFVGIDLPVDNPESVKVAKRVSDDLLKRQGKTSKLIFGDSKSPEVINQVRALAPYDLVFIDGDHTYDGAYADWLNYGPMGKMVAFHDVNSEHWSQGCAKVWKDIKDNYRHIEIIGVDQGMGIGVLWRDELTK